MYELNEKLKFLNQNAVNILKKMCFKNDFVENSVSDQKIDAFFLMNIKITVIYLIKKKLMSFHSIINMITKSN